MPSVISPLGEARRQRTSKAQAPPGACRTGGTCLQGIVGVDISGTKIIPAFKISAPERLDLAPSWKGGTKWRAVTFFWEATKWDSGEFSGCAGGKLHPTPFSGGPK